ncbi:Endothelin-converting enzyme 2 [Bonamia ostreae]|uniref:Endothelin-converting enzyme 2 n=1 Tax=Bonamia ostreae TaxID=126728 RepID=A0ABV2ANR0_9EUKA
MIESIKNFDWMGNNTKKQTIEKIKTIKSVIGISKDDKNDEFLNKFYADIKIGSTFIETLMEAKSFNTKLMFRSLFLKHGVDDMLAHTLTNEANASYDLRFNMMNMNPGIFRLPFFAKNATDVELFGQLGYIVSHEFTHALGPNGMRFDKEGNFNKKNEDGSLENYNKKIEAVHEKVDRICAKTVRNKKTGEKENFTPVFANVAGEIMADLGGVNYSFKAFVLHRGGNVTRSERIKFFKSTALLFCQKESDEKLLKSASGILHPPEYCRVNVISHTRLFEGINRCRRKNSDLTIEMWSD